MLKNPFSRREEETYVELEMDEEEAPTGRLNIEVEKLEQFDDSERLQKKIRKGSILLVNVKDLRTKNLNELKRAVSKIRRTCIALDSNIVGAGDDWLILTGTNAKVHRE